MNIFTISHTAGRINPYLGLFYGALREFGVEWHPELLVNDAWLRRNKDLVDVYHIHWPEHVWRLAGKSKASRLRSIFGFWSFLRLAKRLGIKILWTVHEIYPHNADFVDRLGYRMVSRMADQVIAHSRTALQDIQRQYGVAAKTVMVPLGNYDGVYPPPADRGEVLRGLGLREDLPVVSCLGFIHGYKGFDLAIEAVAPLKGKVQLVIAGPGQPDAGLPAMRAAMKRTGIGVMHEALLTDQELADIAAASEMILLPYRKVTTSSANLTATSLCRGIVCSDLPLFREFLEPEPLAGRLFQSGNVRELTEAISDYLSIPAAERHAAARRLADRYAWRECVAPLEKAFQASRVP